MIRKLNVIAISAAAAILMSSPTCSMAAGHTQHERLTFEDLQTFCSRGGSAVAQFATVHFHHALELQVNGPNSEARAFIGGVEGLPFRSVEVIETGVCGKLGDPVNFEIFIDYIPPGGSARQGSSFQCGVLPKAHDPRLLQVTPQTTPGNGSKIPEGSTIVDIGVAVNTSGSNSQMQRAFIFGATVNGQHVIFTPNSTPSSTCAN